MVDDFLIAIFNVLGPLAKVATQIGTSVKELYQKKFFDNKLNNNLLKRYIELCDSLDIEDSTDIDKLFLKDYSYKNKINYKISTFFRKQFVFDSKFYIDEIKEYAAKYQIGMDSVCAYLEIWLRLKEYWLRTTINVKNIEEFKLQIFFYEENKKQIEQEIYKHTGFISYKEYQEEKSAEMFLEALRLEKINN